MLTQSEEERGPAWFNATALVVSLIAGAIAFLPLALNTSPWDAVTLRVPGNQGNWWHVLIGAPFFLAFPMIWLRLRSLVSKQLSTSAGRRLIWVVVALSICGTILVEVPFLFRLGNFAHMSQRRWLSVICPALGIIIASAALLFLRRRHIFPTRACFVGLDAAYLANAAICLYIYSPWRNSGWVATMAIVWFMALELVWTFIQSFRRPLGADTPPG